MQTKKGSNEEKKKEIEGKVCALRRQSWSNIFTDNSFMKGYLAGWLRTFFALLKLKGIKLLFENRVINRERGHGITRLFFSRHTKSLKITSQKYCSQAKGMWLPA